MPLYHEGVAAVALAVAAGGATGSRTTKLVSGVESVRSVGTAAKVATSGKPEK